jgi:hypothetical protein
MPVEKPASYLKPETLATKAKRGLRRIRALVIILLFIFPEAIFPQCREQFALNESVSLEGISNNTDNYYQNLIIQDIAIANQQAFHEISIRFDYNIRYVKDQCTPGLLEIRVLPVAIKCSPLFYYGYDISASILPEKADLVFHLIQHDGFISDSLIFFDVPLEKDSSLYNSLTASTDSGDGNIKVALARAVFHYTKSSYEKFRDRILQIDQYYAASMLADSALVWAYDGILSETANKAEMILRRVELKRIINYIRPGKFNPVFNDGKDDLNGLTSKYQDLVRLDNRMKAIIHYNSFKTATLSRAVLEKDLLYHYLDRFDYYYQLAFKSDFRFVNFIDDLATPDFTNAGLFALQQALKQNADMPGSGHAMRQWCRILLQGLIERGGSFELKGNQLRALTYYESALELSHLLYLRDDQSTAFQLVGQMRKSISASYVEISRRSALTENPAMAAQYFHNAMNMFADKDVVYLDPVWLNDYENWLFQNFESQAVRYIQLKNYNKALSYLNEIQIHCLSSISYPCPDQFHDWMRMVRDGIYHDLLLKTRNLLAADELAEAEQVYRQATEMRMRAGYRIEKDKSEDELEGRFRQLRYDELIEEGLRNFKREEFSNALYYFNKAYFLERSHILHLYSELFSYRQASARKVMETVLSDGRLKAWAYDFEGAVVALGQVKLMLTDYFFSERDTLFVQYLALDNYIHQNQCDKVFRDYKDLMVRVADAKAKNDFILALNIAIDAVNLSMTNLGCRIRDDEAWYQKILLELPADFQQKEKDLENYSGSCNEYLIAFQELKNFYYHNKLLEQGVVFIPLYDRVIRSKDSLFLTGMLNHYIKLKEFDHSWNILERMRELEFSADPLTDLQKSVAAAFARRDALELESVEPWIKLGSYTGRDKWYRAFRKSYKRTWLQATKWKMQYWPLIWKK